MNTKTKLKRLLF